MSSRSGAGGTTRTSLLRVDGLRVSYGATEAVRGVDFEIARGEVLALVGESGSGKTTTAQAIIGLLAGSGTVTGGTVTFDGDRVDDAGHRRWEKLRGAHIGLVPQDPTTSLNPVKRVGEQVAEVLRIHGRADRRSAAAAAVQILDEAGIDNPELRARQYPQDLSGGQRQRVLIGVALACEPELVIADEPTSALDVTVQRRILDHLADRIAEHNTSVLLITHDLGVAADRADRIGVMRDGEIVEIGPAREVLENPTADYTRSLIASAPSLTSVRLPRATREAQPVLLSLRHVSKTFRIGRGQNLTAVDGVSLDVERGRTVSIVGESGSGKSTTARIALRLENPSAGSVVFDGDDITSARGRELRTLRRRFQIVYQNPYASLNPALRVRDIVAEPLVAFGLGSRSTRPAGRPNCSSRSPWRRSTSTGAPPSCPVGSASGSPSPARWLSTRSCSCSTNRCPHWTSRCRRRFSNSSLGCRKSWI